MGSNPIARSSFSDKISKLQERPSGRFLHFWAALSMCYDASLVRSLQDRGAGELSVFVTDNHPGFATLLDDPVEFTGSPQRCIGDESSIGYCG